MKKLINENDLNHDLSSENKSEKNDNIADNKDKLDKIL